MSRTNNVANDFFSITSRSFREEYQRIPRLQMFLAMLKHSAACLSSDKHSCSLSLLVYAVLVPSFHRNIVIHPCTQHALRAEKLRV